MRKILILLSFIFVSYVGLAAAKDLYYCPMHPSYTSDRPGTCPICNMSLVKKEGSFVPSTQEGHPGHAAITLDLEKRQLIGVKTVAVTKKAIVKNIRAYGKVSRDSRWVFADIFEYERPFLYMAERPLVGLQQKASVDFPAFPGKIFTGKVRLLDKDIDPNSRTTRVRIELDRWERGLKPDMSANVNIEVDLGTSLVVPHSAVLDTGTRQIVFVDQKDGVIVPRVVVLGEKGRDEYQVVSGLAQGEHVVVNGNFMVDSESRLKAVLESAEDSQSGGHIHGN